MNAVLVVPTLARMSLRSTLRSRRLAVAGLVACIPILLGGALIAADASAHTRGDTFRANMQDAVAQLILGGTVPFIAMLLAGSIVADDVEDRTFSYILVRPIRRHQVYLSRLLPAALVAASLAVLQVVAFTLLRLVSWSIYGQGAVETFYTDAGLRQMPALDTILAQGALGVAAAALAAVAFLALFSFVTVLTTRYHFLANILLFATIELTFGNVGGRGAGVLTVTYHARSILMALGEGTSYHAAPWWAAVLSLVAMAAAWTAAASWRMGRRDFNVTSAAS